MLLLSLSANGQRLDISLYDGLALTTEYTTDGIFQFFVFNAECLLCCAQQNNIGRAWHSVVLGSLLNVKHNYIVKSKQVALNNLYIRIIRDIHKRSA